MQDTYQSDDEEAQHVHPLLDNSNKDLVDRIMSDDGSLLRQNPMYAEVKAILEAESTTVPLPTILALTALFVWLVFTDTMKDLVACGSFLFWILVLSIVPVVGGMMAVVRRQLIHKDVVKRAVRPFLAAPGRTEEIHRQSVFVLPQYYGTAKFRVA